MPQIDQACPLALNHLVVFNQVLEGARVQQGGFAGENVEIDVCVHDALLGCCVVLPVGDQTRGLCSGTKSDNTKQREWGNVKASGTESADTVAKTIISTQAVERQNGTRTDLADKFIVRGRHRFLRSGSA